MGPQFLSVTSKPIFQVIQVVFQNQKRSLKTSFVNRIEKKDLPVYGNKSLVDPPPSGHVSAASTPNQPTSSVVYGSGTGMLANPEVGYSTVSHQSNPEMISMGRPMIAASEVQSTNNGVAGNVTLNRGLHVDYMTNHLMETLGESKRILEEKHLSQGHQRAPNGLVDPTTVQQVFYFDTLACMKKLESRGFSRDQAEVCVECLLEIINSTLDHQAKHMITKLQQEIAVQQLLSEIISVKKDMVLLQKSEFSSLRSETEKIGMNMNRIETHFQDELVKLKGQFRLDINLERARAVEAHAENETKLQLLHNKIDTEIANLKTTYEIYRNDVIKFAGGTVLTCATLILGFIRLWK